jgi:hypothetical protein
MNQLVKILMERDNMPKAQAEDMVRDARQRVARGEDPEEILYEEFELEPDYIFDLV